MGMQKFVKSCLRISRNYDFGRFLGEGGVARSWEGPNTPSHAFIWSWNIITRFIHWYLRKYSRKKGGSILHIHTVSVTDAKNALLCHSSNLEIVKSLFNLLHTFTYFNTLISTIYLNRITKCDVAADRFLKAIFSKIVAKHNSS